jgi:hypothetical protein
VVSVLCYFADSVGVSRQHRIEHVGTGNFSAPFPGPLIGFGQNILNQGQTQVFAYADYLKGDQKKFSEVIPSVLYGLTDHLSLYVEAPVALNFELDCESSRGIQDCSVQLEYFFYNNDSLTVSNEMSIVANMTLPTGSSHKVPPTGIGAMSFFLGGTAAQVTTDWYYYAALGLIAPTTTSSRQVGNQLLYEFCISQNIASSPNSWLFNWMAEVNGSYTQRSTILEGTDCDSGGSKFLMGPSLLFATPRFLAQTGIFWFVESLFGTQNEDSYNAVARLSYTF